jgi:putative ABC transport system ATP-binding protein
VSIQIRDLHKVYRLGPERVHALRGVDLTIKKGEFVAIMGASGSGKSTLMNILGCLDRPTQGEYILSGKRTDKMDAAALARVRNEEIGFVFQSFELLNRATALKNVKLPLVYSRRFWRGATARAKGALTRVGLGDRMTHRPNQLSGGQRQRVAIARALVNEPSILLADEPTGNLDSKTSQEIIELFKNLHRQGQTIVIVTHEEDIAGNAERIIRLRDGKVWLDSPTREDPIQREFLRRMAEAAGNMAAAAGVQNTGGAALSGAAAAATAEQARDAVGGAGWTDPRAKQEGPR